jgi:acyl transferase domain-containing protein
MKLIQDDIAIVGMSCIFPQAPNARTFWENILDKKSCIIDHPSPEAAGKIDPAYQGFERLYSSKGGYLGNLAAFNPLDYGVMPDSIDGADPDHFLALRVAGEALADAGMEGNNFPRERTDVIVGHGTYVNPGTVNWVQHGVILDQTLDVVRQLHPEYTEAELKEIWTKLRDSLPPLNAAVIPGVIPNIMSGRIANRLDLMGANYVVDAACASSLLAVDHGVKNLLLGRSDVALVGGVQGCIPPAVVMIFCTLKAMSRMDAPRPFDADADGTMLGEGVGFLVLMRKKDAMRDGRKIYAVIKGLGVSSDGKSQGLLAPRLDGETLAIQRAYEAAEVDPHTVGLVEAHGTGIPLGDATEIRALNNVLGGNGQRRNSVGVGSVKSMIGHCIPAAGMASLIKTSMALHDKIVPPTNNVEKPHPELKLEETPFYISTEPRPWVHGTRANPRRAGVSSMGFGGINTHCVLEEFV